jgi:hypothetical protein
MDKALSRRRFRTSYRPSLEFLETRLTPTTYTVNTLADSGDGSLRAAITSANADTTPDEIDFSVTGVIQLTSGALPAITNTVNINGRSAPGFTGVPLVEIDNNGFGGLILSGNSSILASLSIVHANGAGVTLNGGYANPFGGGGGTGQGINVVGNYIGLDLDGSIAANIGYGVQINDSGSTIGGATAADRNVISGNGGGGIQIVDPPTGFHIADPVGALVLGNFIGTNVSGQAAAPNQGSGVTIAYGGSTIGGDAAGDSNAIAFNAQSGVSMMAPGSLVLGNSIFNNSAKGIDVEGGAFNSPALPAPQLSYVRESPGSTADTVQAEIGGVVNLGSTLASGFGAPGVPCTVRVFATLNGVPAGQGQIFLGSMQVTINNTGFATFVLKNVSMPASSVTLTATLANEASVFVYNTSEFSAPIAIGGNPNNLFVASAYVLLLNRYADPGAAGWASLMNKGVSAAGVVLGIESSTEYLNNQVNALYTKYLRRPADPFGAQAWTNFLLAGGTLEQIAAQFTSSQEFYVLQGGTNQGFITGLYGYVLGRGNFSAGEIASWETLLDAGISRFAVAATFVTSQEYRANLVQSDYMTFLQRPADSGGAQAWVNAFNARATDQQVLAQIFGSQEGYQLWS